MKLSISILGLGAIVQSVASHYDSSKLYAAVYSEPLNRFGKLMNAWRNEEPNEDGVRELFKWIRADYDSTNQQSAFRVIDDLQVRLQVQQHVAKGLLKAMEQMVGTAKVSEEVKNNMRQLIQETQILPQGDATTGQSTHRAEPRAEPRADERDLQRQPDPAADYATQADNELRLAKQNEAEALKRKQQAEHGLQKANKESQLAELNYQRAKAAKEQALKAIQEAERRRRRSTPQDHPTNPERSNKEPRVPINALKHAQPAPSVSQPLKGDAEKLNDQDLDGVSLTDEEFTTAVNTPSQ